MVPSVWVALAFVDAEVPAAAAVVVVGRQPLGIGFGIVEQHSIVVVGNCYNSLLNQEVPPQIGWWAVGNAAAAAVGNVFVVVGKVFVVVAVVFAVAS